MINPIIKGISIALYAEFGDGYKIYAEDVEQGLKEPCFFVSCISSSDRLYFDKRHLRENQFCIQYFPAPGRRQTKECHDIAERLEKCLEYLNAQSGLIRGTKMHYEISDEILHFFVNYDCFIRRRTGDQDGMQAMENRTNVKG